jgi:hypothetical protein
MEPEGSLPCSQELSTGPYLEPDQSSSYRAGSRVFGALCEIIVAPPLVYIVYWYICLTLISVKVHKYFFRFEDYDGICGSTTRDT